MITDSQTNFVYFSDLIRTDKKYTSFWEGLEPILIENKILYGFIDSTRDIWCRDYMPIQISKKDFVQFKYHPDYLVEDHKHHDILTIQSEIGIINGIKPIKSDLIIDGGNIVMSKNSVVMTDKIFKENKGHKEDIIAELKTVLKVDNVFIIPMIPKSYDFTGHADGMVKFLDDNTLLVSDYSYYSISWQKKMKAALDKTGLKIVPFPSINYEKKNQNNDFTAMGVYINFAQIGNSILFPTFDLPKDEEAIEFTRTLYRDYNVIPIDSRAIAEEGGVLNCITWNIRQL
jgi:agmatine deiminase